MYILDKRADQLDETDIKRLVENRIQETKSLDYKKELKIGQDKDKKEFLFDVSAMYNTEGGCLVFGIEESKDEKNQNTGTPQTICGIHIDNSDKITQQIEDIVRGNTEPSIANIIVKIIAVDERTVLIIGIPKGFGLPSMVTFNETNKFYRRRNSGKYAVDVFELNQMFIQNQVLKERAESFRIQRIEKVRSLKVFPTLDNSASLFIQIIPFSFLDENLIDFTNAVQIGLLNKMKPIGVNSWSELFNLDGFATYSRSSGASKMEGYVQVFRNGIYEVYTSRIFEKNQYNEKVVNCVYGTDLIKHVLEKIKDGLIVLKLLKISPPFLVCFSIHGILGGSIISDTRSISNKFTSDEIIFPPIILSTYEINVDEKLKPIFDILWQSVGYSSSPSI